ncbi:unnamed protein product [Amoebophrya sp. A120]|nr:unnamed protein product [Amoebophrya sp. A120]|eukprot:GSA120T00005121001.1
MVSTSDESHVRGRIAAPLLSSRTSEVAVDYNEQRQKNASSPPNLPGSSRSDEHRNYPKSRTSATSATGAPSSTAPTTTGCVCETSPVLIGCGLVNGILNNASFCVLLGASQKMASDFMEIDKVSLLTCLSTVGCLIGILTNAKLCVGTCSEKFRLLLLLTLVTTGYVMIIIAYTALLGHSAGFYLCVLGAAILGGAQAAGEVLNLTLCKSFVPGMLSSWGAGTGLSGIFGPTIYLLLTSGCGLNTGETAFVLIASLPLYFLCFYTVVEKRDAQLELQQYRDRRSSGREHIPAPRPQEQLLEDNYPIAIETVAAEVETMPGPHQQESSSTDTGGSTTTSGSSSSSSNHEPEQAHAATVEGSSAGTTANVVEVAAATTSALVPAVAAPPECSSSRRSTCEGGTDDVAPVSLNRTSRTRTVSSAIIISSPRTPSPITSRPPGRTSSKPEFMSPQRAAFDEDEAEVQPLPLTLENFKSVMRGRCRLIMANMVAVYSLEYLIMSGFVDRVTLCPTDNTFLATNAFTVFWTLYNVGVTLSRASVALFRIQKVYLLTFTQLVNCLLWGTEVFAKVHRQLAENDLGYYIMAVHIVFVGFMGGACYSNCMYLFNTSPDIPAEYRELGLNIGFLFSNVGIITATLLALLLDATVMSKENLFPPDGTCPQSF